MGDNASRDQNFVPTLMGVSNVDGVTPVTIYADPVTHRLLTSPSGTGSGDVVGPASATDNAIARFDTTTGKLLQNSVVTISDTGAITVAGAFTLPIVDGTNGQSLVTNGAGVVSWSNAGTGTVTTVSVASANGFAGTVANPTTTPAITLSTTITGILQGNGTAISAATTTGTGNVVLDNTPTLITPVLGVATATSINKVAITAPATSATLTIADGKTATVNNSITFAGTDATVMTFPTTSATIARTDSAQTFTGVQTMTSPSITTSLVTASTTFALINTVATTINFGGAATTFNIGGTPTTAATFNIATNATATGVTKTVNIGTAGAAGSTTNVNIGSATTSAILGTLSLNFPTILTASNNTTVALWNTLSTTINFAGAATTLTIGGTPTTAITHNYSTNATAAATTKTVNLGTGGAASSTTNINIGASAGGTTTISSPNISLGGTTGVTTTGTIELGAASDTTISRSAAGVIAVEGVVIPSISSTNTLTNKRITPRVTSITSNVATPTINTDNCDIVVLTGQTNNITSMTTNLSGTPTDGQMLRIAMTAASGAPTVTWGASFEDSTVTAPTALSTTRVDVGFVWNVATSKWRCVAKA